MIDIDHFKRLSSTPTGIRKVIAACAVAAILDGCLQRGDDLLARYGGEEFIAALPSPDVPRTWAWANGCAPPSKPPPARPPQAT
jgi:GGDEF domain-containing protein